MIPHSFIFKTQFLDLTQLFSVGKKYFLLQLNKSFIELILIVPLGFNII